MSIEISHVNVGDKVRITRENGDEATFTVTSQGFNLIKSEKNSFHTESWDSLEIVESKFDPVPGVYSDRNCEMFVVILPDGRAFFTHARGSWILTRCDGYPYSATYDAARQLKGWTLDQAF